MKIITFTKNNQFQALLQYSEPVNAQQAKLVSFAGMCVSALLLRSMFQRSYECALVLRAVLYVFVSRLPPQ